MVGTSNLIDQQAGRSVHVADDGGDSAVIPSISNRQSARRRRRGDARSRRRRNIAESSIAVVVIKNAGLLIAATQMLAVHFGINMAVHQDEIGPAIVVKVEKHGSPAQILRI